MKRRWLIIPFLTLAFILVLTLLPVSFISANPGNLARNSGFSDGFNDWGTENNVSLVDETAYAVGGSSLWTGVYQYINTSKRNLTFSFDYKAAGFSGYGDIDVGFDLWDGPNYQGGVEYEWTSPLDVWFHDGETISSMWKDQHGGASLPDFDYIEIWVGVYDTAKVFFDNVKLTYHEASGEEEEEEVWVRDHEMTCYQVWKNEANNFEFVFWWEYYNNNWVKIYDMAGNEVFSIDMKKGSAHFEAALPDGMYTVKTFHNGFEHPIQEFVIGKP